MRSLEPRAGSEAAREKQYDQNKEKDAADPEAVVAVAATAEEGASSAEKQDEDNQNDEQGHGSELRLARMAGSRFTSSPLVPSPARGNPQPDELWLVTGCKVAITFVVIGSVIGKFVAERRHMTLDRPRPKLAGSDQGGLDDQGSGRKLR
jgi:hypothetical protein